MDTHPFAGFRLYAGHDRDHTTNTMPQSDRNKEGIPMGLRIQGSMKGHNTTHLVCKKSSYEMPSMSFGPIGSLPNGVWRTSGTDPRPFAVSGVMVNAPTITQTVPTYSRMKPSHRTIWTQMSAI